MISLMPEYAPPAKDESLRLLIGGHCTCKFTEETAISYLQQISEEIIYTMVELYIPIFTDIENVTASKIYSLIDMELLMEHVKGTGADEVTVNNHFTSMLHNLILHRVNILKGE